MRILIITLATLLVSFYTRAQSDSIHQSCLQLMAGAVHNRMVDTGLSFNRQAFTGMSFKFFAGFDRRKNNSMLLASFEMNGGKLKMSDEQVPADITNGQIATSYLFKTASYNILGKSSRLYLGPKLSGIVHYVHPQKLDNEAVFAVYGLYLHAFQHLQLSNTSSLDASITLPAIAFTKRLAWDGGLYTPENTETLSVLLDDTQVSFAKVAEFNAAYSKRLSRLTYLNVRYRFAYLASSEFGDLRFYSNEVLIGFNFFFHHE